jgi:glycosidase
VKSGKKKPKTLMGDIYLQQDHETLAFGNTRLELQFSLSSGNWIGCIDRTENRWCIGGVDSDYPTVLLRVNGERTYSGVVRNSRVYDLKDAQEIGSHVVYEGHQVICLDREVALEISAREGDWTITSIFRLSPASDTLNRDLRLSYHGQTEAFLRDVRLIVPKVSVGRLAETWLEAPDYPVTSHFPLSELGEGIWPGLESRTLTISGKVQHSVDAPGSVVGMVALHHPASDISLMTWPHSTSEFSIMEVIREGDRIDFIHWLFLSDRFGHGHTLEAGRQYLRLSHENWDGALRRFQRWYETIKLRVPCDRPQWALGTAIYEVHIGRAPFKDGVNYEPYPTVANLTEDLPRIADLDFEVIQVMPHWPYCGYTVHDYHDIDLQYGDEDELKAMVQRAHELGLKVILDVVLHGCADKEIIRWDMAQFGPYYDFIFKEWLQRSDERSRYRDEHPEWFMQNEQGETAKVYTWAFDAANCSYQDFLIDVLKHYITDLGVDGFRFDAPTWNCMPNWADGLPYRASTSYYGAYHLMRRVREAIKRSHPQAMLYTEPSGPLFRQSMDVTYNYDVEWLSGSLMKVVSERGYAGAGIYDGRRITAKQAGLWLHYRSLALPPGSITVQHLDSHDTFWWGEMAQFRREAFGDEAARALFAMFALQGGGIMNYVGAERGSEVFYRRLLKLRRNHPVLRYGACDFLAVGCDHEMVLSLFRIYGDEHAIPLINLGEEEARVHLRLPLDRLGFGKAQACIVRDLFNVEDIRFEGAERMTAEALDRLSVYLPPYGVRVLQVQPEGAAAR